MTDDNPYARSARLTKAQKLADVAVALVAQIDDEDGETRPADAADALEAMADADQHWEELARIAGTRPPSRTTREAVIELLRDRARSDENVEAAIKRAHPLGPGPCDWSCGRRATITLKTGDGRWHRICGKCYRSLNTTATASMARTIQGG